MLSGPTGRRRSRRSTEWAAPFRVLRPMACRPSFALPVALAVLVSLPCGAAEALPGAAIPVGIVRQFDALATAVPPADPSEDAIAGEVPSDLTVERKLAVELEFPDEVSGHMFTGTWRGERAVFTRSGPHLDISLLRQGQVTVISFTAPPLDAEEGERRAELSSVRPTPSRSRRSVPPGHFEDPAAYSLHFHFFRHDDLLLKPSRELHARFVAWWLADMAGAVLPVEPMRATYLERVPWVTDMAYGHPGSLEAFAHVLGLLGEHYRFDIDKTYKRKFILLTASRPGPGIGGLAFQGGNEAIARVNGRDRIVAHEIGHLLGATHALAERPRWWGCESNMVAAADAGRGDCMYYTAANERAIRSYMRHGPALPETDAIVVDD